MKRRISLGLAWLGLAWLGCSPAEQPPSQAVKPVSAKPLAPSMRIDGAAFDFGPCLAAGQTIRHEFPLVNLTEQDVPILGVMAFTPCCSTIGPTPRVVPAGKTVMIPVTLHVGSTTGRKRVEFALATGGKVRRQHGMSLTIALLGESEVLRPGDADSSIPINRPHHCDLVLEIDLDSLKGPTDSHSERRG